MKLSLRKVALILGAVALLGLPVTLSRQSPRDEHIVVAARDDSGWPIELPSTPAIQAVPTVPARANSDLPIELPSAPIVQATLTKPARANSDLPIELPPAAVVLAVPKDESETPYQRPPTREAYAPPRPYESLELYIHLPPDAAKHQPLRPLIVLHGIGAHGGTFSQSLIEEADRNYWLLIAPTMPYLDYMDPTNLLKEDVRFSALLADMLDNLPKKLGMKLRRHALVFGFSRGAQLGHRFALFYPERVESIVAISAGTYTLPAERKTSDPTVLMPMPYGVGDMVNYVGHPLNREELRKVSLLIQVGANDNNANEVPRQFDPYSGKDRVARAAAFVSALLALDVNSRLSIYPNAGHEITYDMRKTALQFLRDEELSKKLND